MAHFAELSHADPTPDNPATVLRVVVVDNRDIMDGPDDENAKESEAKGVAHLQAQLGGEWAQTSYHSTIRRRFASKQCLFDGAAFYNAQPFPSWTLDSDHVWQPPVAEPADRILGRAWIWKEDTQAWFEDVQPPSWTWNPDHTYPDPTTGEPVVSPQYEPPKPKPQDGRAYIWNEDTGNWNLEK
jgi:hypothetical protein